MRSGQPAYKRQWRDYQTESGARPIKDFLLALADEDRAAVLEELEGFQKKTQQTPKAHLKLAEQRLADWRRRGKAKRVGQEK